MRAESAVGDLTKGAESIAKARASIVPLSLGKIWALVDDDSVACFKFADGCTNGLDGSGSVASRDDGRCNRTVDTLCNLLAY